MLQCCNNRVEKDPYWVIGKTSGQNGEKVSRNRRAWAGSCVFLMKERCLLKKYLTYYSEIDSCVQHKRDHTAIILCKNLFQTHWRVPICGQEKSDSSCSALIISLLASHKQGYSRSLRADYHWVMLWRISSEIRTYNDRCLMYFERSRS